MDTNQDAIKDDLKVLNIDVSGFDSNSEFQKLGNAYERVLKAVVDITNNRETVDEEVTDKKGKSWDDDEEKFVRENFHNFNFPADKDGHFVVVVQNELADVWAEVFENNYGAPRINTRAGKEVSRLWKICFNDTNLTIHFYNNPKSTKISKFLVQGGNHAVKHLFVFDELPAIYKSVCAQKPRLEMKKTEHLPYKCNQCKVTSKTLADLRKHSKTKHKKLDVTTVHLHETIETRKSIKRLPMFTPNVKQVKKSKYEETINSEKILDENLSMLNMSTNESSILVTLDEPINCENTNKEEDQTKLQEQTHEESRSYANCYCSMCGESFQQENQLDAHVEQAHEVPPALEWISVENVTDPNLNIAESIIICGECGIGYREISEAENHMKNHVDNDTDNCSNNATNTNSHDTLKVINTEVCLKCADCAYVGTKCEIEKHRKEVHTENSRCECKECSQACKSTKVLNDPMTLNHISQEPFPCEVCGLVLANFQLLQTHITNIHTKEFIKCQHCDKQVDSMESLRTHMDDEHAEYVVLHTMAKQVDAINNQVDDFDKMKAILGHTLQTLQILNENQKTIIGNQNEIKQELFLLRNIEAEKSEYQRSRSKTDENTSKTTTTIPTKQQSEHSPRASAKQPERSVQERNSPKILLIGDSISTNVNIKALEEATEAKFVTAKAYTAIYDTEQNEAKMAAKFPKSNFTDVIPSELEKGNFKTMVLQAGAVDITNLNTKVKPEQHIEYFKQVTVVAAQNLFLAAEKALESQNNLEKIVIMKQTPRYDPLNVDPLSLKPALAELYNKTLTDCWMNSNLKQNITMGTHNIDCSGSIREARYRNTQSGRFDGVHLYGSSGQKAYTLSVLNILKAAELTTPEHNYHQTCNQARYQQQRMSRYRQGGKQNYVKWNIPQTYQVPTYNRFNTLSGAQGNW